MGLPVVTCAGDTFVSRVAGSLLTAMNVPELVTYDLDDYYALALDLAQNHQKRKDLRNKIMANRDSAPLFDSERFTRNLEAAYAEMWDEHHRACDKLVTTRVEHD
jgi:predicted O-linked N-acetylglucosamine transferase (SPINDLY family)